MLELKKRNAIFEVMDALSADPANPNPVIPVAGNLTSNALADAFANIERADIRVTDIFLNAKDYACFKEGDVLIEEDNRILNAAGTMAWGAKLIVSRDVPEGRVYVCGGGIPVSSYLLCRY